MVKFLHPDNNAGTPVKALERNGPLPACFSFGNARFGIYTGEPWGENRNS